MPNSPIGKQLTGDAFQKDWDSLEKVIIPDSKTAHYYGVWFDETGSDAELMCCHLDENPSVNDNWYHVEVLEEEHRSVLDTIRDVFGISFHESIWVEMGSEEVFPAMGIDDLTPE